MRKEIYFGKEAREKVKKGIDTVANAVKVTLGANGKTVLIKQSYVSPQGYGVQYLPLIQTKDGVTVARSLTLSDQLENVGADIIKDAAGKTMDLIGDGTTTTCVLVQSIVDEALKLVDSGKSANEVKREIDGAVEKVVSYLKKVAIPVGTDIEKIRQIATVSANNDEVIGNLIADAFQKIGNDGVITIEESNSSKTYIETINGFQFEHGWISPYFISKGNSKNECVLENPLILLYEKKLTILEPILKLLEQVFTIQKRSLLIICDDADGEALATLSMNVYNQKIPHSCIVKAPSFGEGRRTAMEDIALLVGGEYISEEKGFDLASIKVTDLGTASKVIISKNSTIIIGGNADKKPIEDLINNLKMDATKASVQEKEMIEKRIAKLNGGAAVLYVGGSTETEMKEIKDRCDDSVRAVKAAIAEGYVAGGGSCFVRATKLDIPEFMKTVLKSPLLQICENSGVKGETIIDGMISGTYGVIPVVSEMGYNAKTDKVEDLIKSGIIDPVKALRCSLEHAASAAGTLISSDCLICDVI